MHPALTQLLGGIIDYAGLFPPAKLSLEDSVANFLAYKSGPESWIVNRFVVTTSRLDDLQRELEKRPNVGTFPVTVVGASGTDLDSFETNLEHDAKAMTAFEAALGERAPIEGFEVRLPSYDLIDRVIRDLKAFDSIDVFLELPWGEAQSDGIAAVAETEWMGIKGRTGGLEPSAVPSPDALAAFLQQCLDLDVDFKLTAGLHEPLRHHDSKVGAEVHGFLNVISACLARMSEDAGVSEMARILGDTHDGHARLTSSGFSWGEMSFGSEVIADLRDRFCGFGSCSVMEPLEGLEKLGLLAVKA